MAADWVRMRVWLARDPKVIFMADHIANDREFMDWLTNPVQVNCSKSAYEHVTRDVCVALCVTALSQIWGTALGQGRRDRDDLVVPFCDAASLDSVCGIPGIGRAMIFVRWLQEDDGTTVRFLNYFREQELLRSRHAMTAAERQRKYRAARRNENRDARVAPGVTEKVTKVTKVSPQSQSQSQKKASGLLAPGQTGSLSRRLAKENLTVSDLRSTPRLLQVVDALAEVESYFKTDDGRLHLVAAAERVLIKASSKKPPEDPIRIFSWIVCGMRWTELKPKDLDHARIRILTHERQNRDPANDIAAGLADKLRSKSADAAAD